MQKKQKMKKMKMKNKRLFSKTVVISGVSSGLGKGIATTLVQQYGCRVIGIARNREKCEEMAANLGEKFSYLLFDVSVRENWDILKAYLTENGIVPDVLVNNVGILPPFRKWEKYPEEMAELVMRTNFFSALYGIQTVLPFMQSAEEPMIYNIASSAALCPLPGITYYSASKAALLRYSEVLIAEHKRDKLHVGVICPGFTRTEIFRNQATAVDAEKKDIIQKISMPCDKMVKKIVRAMEKRKKRKVFGWDAKGMNLLYKLAPVKGVSLCEWIMRKANISLFRGIFED